MTDDLERGEDVVEIEDEGYLYLWDGTAAAWIRCRPPLRLKYWR